jgi:hypothetical protein
MSRHGSRRNCLGFGRDRRSVALGLDEAPSWAKWWCETSGSPPSCTLLGAGHHPVRDAGEGSEVENLRCGEANDGVEDDGQGVVLDRCCPYLAR